MRLLWKELDLLAKERSRASDLLPVWLCAGPRRRGGRGLGPELCKAFLPLLRCSPRIARVSGEAYGAEPSVPSCWCLKQFCGGSAEPREPVSVGESRVPSARHASLLHRQPPPPSALGGGAFSPRNGPAIFGLAFFLPGCCPHFFLPFLPFPPGGQGGNHRVAVSVVGRQWLCLQGGWAPIPRLTSQLPKDCDAHGIPRWASGKRRLGLLLPQWVASPPREGSRCSDLTASFQLPIPPV